MGVAEGMQRQAEGLRGEAEQEHSREEEVRVEALGGHAGRRDEAGEQELAHVPNQYPEEDGQERRALRLSTCGCWRLGFAPSGRRCSGMGSYRGPASQGAN